jgi:hypothetical protein
VGEGVFLLSSPLRELVQTVLDSNLAAAALIPWCRLLLRCRALGLGDEHISQTEGDVECAFEQFRSLVHGVYDVCLRPVLVSIEGTDICTVSGHTHERDLAGTGAPDSAANGGGKVDTCAVASGLKVVLALEHG